MRYFFAAKTPWSAQIMQGLVTIGGIWLVVDIIRRNDEVPVTGRRRYMAVPMVLERAVGRVLSKSYEELETRVPDSDPEVDFVRRVADRAVRVANSLLPGGTVPYDWRVLVVDSNEVNAFCAPGGLIVVYTGLLRWLRANSAKLQSEGVSVEEALAVVMCHEMAHAVARHVSERMSWWPFLTLVVFLQQSSPLLVQMVSLGFSLPMSRKMESEADRIGLEIMSQACFNIHAAPIFHKAMAGRKTETNLLSAYTSTHPSSHDRAEACRTLVKQMHPEWTKRCPPKQQSISSWFS